MNNGNPQPGAAMTHLAGFARRATFAIPVVCLALVFVAAAPPLSQESPEELVRQANEQFRAGNTEAADALYTTAEERTTDPGLVSFNRAAILFERKQFREAEQLYDRVLDDAECPPERAAKAWYNRGTCLLNRGGSMSVYRSAIACFEHALESTAADEPLKADARHNLELAKLLWLEEAKKEKKDPPSPNQDIPQEEERPQQPRYEPQPGGSDSTPPTIDKNASTQPQNGQQGTEKTNIGQQAEGNQNAGANNPNLQAPKDDDAVQPMSPDDARAYLKETAKWRKKQLHSLLETLYGPERPDVNDR